MPNVYVINPNNNKITTLKKKREKKKCSLIHIIKNRSYQVEHYNQIR